ncbi:MAG: efflux RND transporter permease subunit [Limnochordales bacterium]|nr:efflux RND transporter permease subunit [Limnochordales bacterium]
MQIIKWAVARPIGTFMITLTLLVFGAVTLPQLSVDLFPQIDYPVASVAVIYPGATPETIQEKVTNPLQAALAGLPDVRHTTSYSLENVGVVILEFEWGTNITQRLNEMQAQVSRLSLTLPEDIEPPLVLATDPRQYPVLLLALQSEKLDLETLTQKAELEIAPALRQVPDVVQVAVEGGARPRLEIRYDQERLRELGLNHELLSQLLVAANTYVPANPIEEGGRLYQIRTGYSLQTVDDLADVVVGVKTPQANPLFPFMASVPQLVRLKDIATITRIAADEQAATTRVNGKPTVLLRIQKRSDANTVKVVDAVNARLQQLRLEEQGIKIYPLIDQSLLVRRSLDSLTEAGVVAALLTVLSLYPFLRRRWVELLLITFSIPLSVSITLIVMRWLGQTLNLMTLAGIALALGMVVDNAIVVTENFSRLRDQGLSAEEAAMTGAGEVAGAITASTLTTIAVFLPVVFVRGLASTLFGPLGLTVTLALLASLAVALTVVPATAARILRGRSFHPALTSATAAANGAGLASLDGTSEAASALAEPEQDWLHRIHMRILTWSLQHRLAVAAFALLAFAASLTVLPGLGIELIPVPDEDVVTVKASLPAGTASSRTLQLVEKLEAALQGLPDIEWVAAQVGSGSTTDVSSLLNGGTHRAQLTIRLRAAARRQRSNEALLEELTARLSRAASSFSPDASVTVVQGGGYGSLAMLQEGAIITEVRGPDKDKVELLAKTLAERLRSAGAFSSVDTDLQQGLPELRYTISPARAAMASALPGQIGLTVRQALANDPILYIKDAQGHTLPVELHPDLTADSPRQEAASGSLDRKRLAALEIPGLIARPDGTRSVTTLGRVATPEETVGPAILRQVDGLPAVQVRAFLGRLSQAEGVRIVRSVMAQLQSGNVMPEGYEISIVGTQELIDESLGELWLVLLLSIFLIYVVMAVQFESISKPLLIMLTIPLGATGSLVALALTRTPLGLSSGMGLVMLGGIIVNNAIVLIDRIQQLRQQGIALRPAVLLATSTRLRPILMTAITTIVGLFPLIVGPYARDTLQTPLAIALLGGLVVGTSLTLVVIPVLYEWLESWRARRENSTLVSRKSRTKEELQV